jgi:plasmid stabilization system protein ParE
MTYSLHPGAEHDIANALDFYSEQAGLVVAERFLDEFERIAKLLVEHPSLGTPTTRGRRTFPLKVFPYSVVYRNLESGIRILIVRHQHRKPGYASGRR